MQVLAIIPARYASSRFPGKPLQEIEGKTMIQRVYEQAQKTDSINKVIVATDDERIFQAVQGFGGAVEMTQTTHQSGTDRCAEVADRQPDFDIVVNIQGDEPFIQPGQIERAIHPLLTDNSVSISTLAKAIQTEETLFNPNAVKVVFAKPSHKALYFSRSTIPFLRNINESKWLEQHEFYKHIGLYGFRRKALLEVAQLSPSRLEQLEALEQLRWLEAGYTIAVAITEQESMSVDTPEDLEQLLANLRTKKA